MKKIKLALVGRPNVGKSSLFNRICGKKIAIVDEAEGTTRDRLYGETEFMGHHIEVIDTGGIDMRSTASYGEDIRRQAEIALQEADVIIMVVDGTGSVAPLDEEVARLLVRKKKPLCLAVNKIDNLLKVHNIHEFHSLGIAKMTPVSASQGFNIAELLESALEGFERPTEQIEESVKTIKVAIVGRPNVGKSTLLNRLLNEDRSLVGPVAGTTRDSIDATLQVGNVSITLIDTAGIRRKNSESQVVEKFAAIRTERAIDRADICLLMLDAEEGLTNQDKRIANYIEKEGKGCALIFNKWDLLEGYRMEHCLSAVRAEASFLSHCPTVFISAQEGRNIDKLVPIIEDIRANQQQRITTGQLNRFLERAVAKYHPPMIDGKRLRIYYMAQVGIQPPTFVLFVNYPKRMLDTYKKYLVHQFRETYSFSGNPIVFLLKARERRELPDAGLLEK